jgi:hypothetical protein
MVGAGTAGGGRLYPWWAHHVSVEWHRGSEVECVTRAIAVTYVHRPSAQDTRVHPGSECQQHCSLEPEVWLAPSLEWGQDRTVQMRAHFTLTMPYRAIPSRVLRALPRDPDVHQAV